MTLKHKDDLDILKLYLHTENEAASLRHSKLREQIQKLAKVKGQGQNVKSSKCYRNRYADQAQAVSNQ